MRYLPLTADDRCAMLKRIGVADIGALFADIPQDKRVDGLLDLPRAQSEIEIERKLTRLAAENIPASTVPFFIGAGAYKHHVPASVDHLIQRSEFLTSYTPYQPEIAQGTLQTIFEFQTQVAVLTGMEVANASMYDGSTAAAEAVLMAHRITKRPKAVLSGGLHPHYAETVVTQARMAGIEILRLPPDLEATEAIDAELAADIACVVVQTPDLFGNLRDLRPLANACRARGVLLVAVFTEAIALGLIEPPGAMGADIVVGEGQSIGNPLSFGGPYVGLFATRQQYVRHMPGRLAGETIDLDGRRGFTLTLSTREQHIRRDKATSNICTNAGLCCLAFSIHLSLLGAAGLRRLAHINHANAVQLADRLSAVKGVDFLNRNFFNEFTIRIAGDAATVVETMARRGVLGGVPLARLWPEAGFDDLILIANTEINTDDDRAAFVAALQEAI